MLADILQAGPAIIEQFLPGVGHGGDRRRRRSSSLRQHGLARLVEAPSLIFQVAGGGCIAGPDDAGPRRCKSWPGATTGSAA